MEQLYSLKSAAELLDISVDTVKRLLRKHNIQHCYVGTQIRITESDIKKLITKPRTLDDYRVKV